MTASTLIGCGMRGYPPTDIGFFLQASRVVNSAIIFAYLGDEACSLRSHFSMATTLPSEFLSVKYDSFSLYSASNIVFGRCRSS